MFVADRMLKCSLKRLQDNSKMQMAFQLMQVRENARPLKCASDVDVCQHGDCFPFPSKMLHLFCYEKPTSTSTFGRVRK